MVSGRGQRLCKNCFPVRNCSIVTSLVSAFFFFYFNIQASSFLSLYLHHWRTSRHCFSHRDSGVCVCVFSSNYSTLLKPAPLGSNRKYSQDFLSRSHALKQDTSAEPAHCLNWFHNCCRHFARVRVCFSSIRYQLPVE